MYFMFLSLNNILLQYAHNVIKFVGWTFLYNKNKLNIQLAKSVKNQNYNVLLI